MIIRVVKKMAGDSPLVIKTAASYRCKSFKTKGFENPQSVEWKPLKAVGEAYISPSDIFEAYDHQRIFRAPKGISRPRMAIPDSNLLGMVDDLFNLGCIAKAGDDEPLSINMSIRPKPGSDKCLCIADARPVICREAIASSLFEIGDFKNLWAVKLDLQNAYWSVKLPTALVWAL